MFLRIVLFRLGCIYIYIWGDYIKILILFEILRILVLRILIYYIRLNFFSLNYFLALLIFLVCESSLGFIFFIFYIRIESDVVKKINLIQF